MSESNTIFLIGYKKKTRRYLLQTAIGCGVLSLVLLFIFGHVSSIPLLVVTGCLTGELCWRSKKPLMLIDGVLYHHETKIPRDEIVRFSTWGPFGIPWTPIKLKGITFYTKDDAFSVHSRADGFDQLVNILKTLHLKQPQEPLWYNYPLPVIRMLRYIIAFVFAFIFLLVFALSLLVILAAVVACYFIFHSLVKSHRSDNQAVPEDAWIAGAASLILFCVLYSLFQSYFLALLIGVVPTLVILWFPWKPASLSIISDALFQGTKKAYPFRHLRTTRMVSRFFILKIWRLSFANGDVYILPLLEDFDEFKKKIEKQWDDSQKYYRDKKMTKEEQEVRTPQEEARQINFFKTGQSCLSYPLIWQFLLPAFFLGHLFVLGCMLWIIYSSLVGKIIIIGLFLKEMLPVVLIVYGCYILFSLLPKFFYVYKKYYLKDDGIYVGKEKILWSDIHNIVPYQDMEKKNQLTLFDKHGKALLNIKEDIIGWSTTFQKIETQVKAIRKRNPIEYSSVQLLSKRTHALKQSKSLLIILAILVMIPFSLKSVIDKQNKSLEKSTRAVTLPARYLFPKFIGKRILIIPYQTYDGNIWYSLAYTDPKKEKPKYMQTNVDYYPDDPIFSYPYGKVKNIFFPLFNYLESQGVSSRHLKNIEKMIYKSSSFLWVLAIVILLFAFLHSNLFAGIFTQKMPPPLGPKIYIHGAISLQNSIKLVLHLILLIILLIISFYLFFPNFLSVNISVYYSGLWSFLAIFLPVLLCPYIGFFIFIAIPQWLYSFRKWTLEEDGIVEKKVKIQWNEITNIAIFNLPVPSLLPFLKVKKEKVALIEGRNNKKIYLSGQLIHFDTIIAHIRKKSKCSSKDIKGLRYFYKKVYSRSKLIHLTISTAMFLLLMFLIFTMHKDQQTALKNGKITDAKVIEQLYNFAFISYQDDLKKNWYTVAWKTDEVKSLKSLKLIYSPDFPAFWESGDSRIKSLGNLVYTIPGIDYYLILLKKNIFWLIAGVPGILTLLFLWHFMGLFWGFPPKAPST